MCVLYHFFRFSSVRVCVRDINKCFALGSNGVPVQRIALATQLIYSFDFGARSTWRRVRVVRTIMRLSAYGMR